MKVFKEIGIYSYIDLKSKHIVSVCSQFNDAYYMHSLYKRFKDRQEEAPRLLFREINDILFKNKEKPLVNKLKIYYPYDFYRLSYHGLCQEAYSQFTNNTDLENTFIYISNNKYISSAINRGLTLPITKKKTADYPILWFADLYARCFYNVFINKKDIKTYLPYKRRTLLFF